MTLLKTKPEKLTRIPIKDIEKSGITGDPVASKVLDYIDGAQRGHTEALYLKRFCRRITKAKDDKDKTANGAVYYADPIQARQAAVNSGLYEIVVLDTMGKVISVMGSLGRDTDFTFLNADGKPNTDFKADIMEARKAGAFDMKIARLEEIAVGVGSSVAHVQILGPKFDYMALSPDMVTVCHSTHIYDGDYKRPTNYMDVEEATLVVVNLGSVGNGESSFVAYYGRAEGLESGRMVSYRAKTWDDIPDFKTDSSGDHIGKDGGPANPFTVLQDESGDWEVPEIPIAIWRGTVNGVGDVLLPVSTTLYDNDLEVNLAASRCMTANIKSAMGMVVVSKETGASPVIDGNMGESMSVMNDGQSVNVLSVPAINSEILMGNIEKITAYMSESKGVASYKTTISNGTAVPSAVALVELNKPEERVRQARGNMNRHGMDRIFQIEKAIAANDHKQPSLNKDISQLWIIHSETYAESAKDELEIAIAEKDVLRIKGTRQIARERVEELKDASDDEVDEYLVNQEIAAEVAPVAPAISRLGLPPDAAR